MKNLFIFFLLISFASHAQYDTAIAILQALTMSHDGTRAAAQQNYWLQDANGEVFQNVSFPETKNYRFDFTGHGSKTFSGTWTQLSIKVDDVVKTTLTIDNANPDIWTAIINVSSGTHKVSLAFVNDNGGASYRLYMCLLYIFPVNLANSNDPVIYPAINKNHSLPTFGTGFLISDDFNSGHLRGFTTGLIIKNQNTVTPKDFSDMAAKGANLIRIWISLRSDGTNYSFVRNVLDSADAFIHRAYLNHIWVDLVITDSNTTEQFWGNTSLKNSYIQRISEVAARYKDSTCIGAISLANEPDIVGHLGEWLYFAQQLASAVRRNDTNHVIIMPANTGNQDQWVLSEPLAFSNVVYEIHSYQPFDITHQGVNTGNIIRTRYPNDPSQPFYNSKLGLFDKNTLSATLQQYRSFSAKYNAPCLVGEFSCAGWAPDYSSCRYIADAISLFNEMDWSWAYVNFRQYEAWDAEISPAQWYTYSFTNAAPVVAGGYGTLDTYRADSTCATQTMINYLSLNQFTPSGVRVADTSCIESSGTVTVRVYLDSATPVPMSVDYYLINGSATFPKDFKQIKGTLQFNIGDITKFIPVSITKDKISETTENFYLQIFNAVNASIADDKGEVQIINNP